jgi:two-component system, cell cycle sensor histidine kinase and response regulator CckA
MGVLDPGPVPHGSETILLVEADPETRKLGAFMLERRGYTVLEARSTAEALRVSESTGAPIDLLLTELMLPPKSLVRPSGIDLAARLLALRPGLRVLYMSHAESNRMARHMEMGLEQHFLQKPFTMRMLAEKVRQALDAPQSRVAGVA